MDEDESTNAEKMSYLKSRWFVDQIRSAEFFVADKLRGNSQFDFVSVMV